MRKENMSRIPSDYIDNVTFDLLYFLNEKMDSDLEKETWYSELEYPNTLKLGEVYEQDQNLSFYGSEYDTDIFLLDNNKLVVMLSSEYDYERGFSKPLMYFSFIMLSNADDYVIKIDKNENGRIDFMLDNGKGIQILDTDVRTPLDRFSLPLETHIVNVLEPISFEQIYERGFKGKEKQKTRSKKKIVKENNENRL